MLGDKENFWCFTQNMGTTEYKFFAIASSTEQKHSRYHIEGLVRGEGMLSSFRFYSRLKQMLLILFLQIEQFLQLHVYGKTSHLTTPDL